MALVVSYRDEMGTKEMWIGTQIVDQCSVTNNTADDKKNDATSDGERTTRVTNSRFEFQNIVSAPPTTTHHQVGRDTMMDTFCTL